MKNFFCFLVSFVGIVCAASLDSLQQFRIDMTKAINNFRISQGSQPLCMNANLNGRAQKHSEYMAKQGRISHDGIRSRLGDLRNYAENVAMTSGRNPDVNRVMDMFIDSPGHRRNLLGKYNLVGVGLAKSGNGSRTRWYYTQDFARKSSPCDAVMGETKKILKNFQ